MGRPLRPHRSKDRFVPAPFVAPVALAALAAACHKSPDVTTRTVFANTPQACAVSGSVQDQYYAYGDFEPTPPQTTHLLSAVGTPLAEIDDATRALRLSASEDTETWEGLTAVPPTGDINVLLLPMSNPCALTSPVGTRIGSTMAPIDDQSVMIAGGTAPKQEPVTYVAHLDTGEVVALPESSDLHTPRTLASVTAFGQGALVAGGISPANQVLSDAEVYSSARGGFGSTQIPLSGPRMGHGSVVLSSGQTLLVGGLYDTTGDDVLASLEIVDPELGQSLTEGLGELTVARTNPTVLRLASGEILVAGGTDGSGNAVKTLEWFNADGTPSSNKSPQDLAQGAGSAFMALQAGGALAVLTTPDGAMAGFQNVYVIDATGVPDPATPLTDVTHPVLFGGAEGSPVLWTGDTSGGRWLQWQPYAGAFGELDVIDDTARLVDGSGAVTTATPDPGMAMWLDPTQSQLVLLRFDTSNVYSPLPGPLLVLNTANGTLDTAPDRLGAVSWDTEKGLTLQAGTPGAAVFVTDRTYADVAVDLDVVQGPVAIALRDEVDLGSDGTLVEVDVPGPTCTADAGLTPPNPTLHVERHGTAVTWSIAGGPSGSCTGIVTAGARVAVGVRATSSVSGIVDHWVVTRLGTP